MPLSRGSRKPIHARGALCFPLPHHPQPRVRSALEAHGHHGLPWDILAAVALMVRQLRRSSSRCARSPLIFCRRVTAPLSSPPTQDASEGVSAGGPWSFYAERLLPEPGSLTLPLVMPEAALLAMQHPEVERGAPPAARRGAAPARSVRRACAEREDARGLRLRMLLSQPALAQQSFRRC